ATSAALTKAGDEPELTRTGDFTSDAYGHLVNSTGRALLGQKLDAATGAGTKAPTSVADLELVSMNDMAGYFEGSTFVSLKAALPLDQAVSTSGDLLTNAPVKTVVTAVDAKGQAAAVGLSLIKTADDPIKGTTWEIYQTGATYADGTAVPGAPTTQTLLGNMAFGPGGAPTGGTDGENIAMTMSLGSNFGAVTLNPGAYNEATGLTVTAKDASATSFSTATDGILPNSMEDV
ncbi:hypothetical protein JZU48_00320, partial [bacterium]|nr:hypothetical protein [bacterium]